MASLCGKIVSAAKRHVLYSSYRCATKGRRTSLISRSKFLFWGVFVVTDFCHYVICGADTGNLRIVGAFVMMMIMMSVDVDVALVVLICEANLW